MNSDYKITYEFEEELIRAYVDGEVDEFDFSLMPEGELDKVETVLKFNPIVSAKREDGELRIELLYFHDWNATEEERFPVWTDYSEIKVGVHSG